MQPFLVADTIHESRSLVTGQRPVLSLSLMRLKVWRFLSGEAYRAPSLQLPVHREAAIWFWGEEVPWEQVCLHIICIASREQNSTNCACLSVKLYFWNLPLHRVLLKPSVITSLHFSPPHSRPHHLSSGWRQPSQIVSLKSCYLPIHSPLQLERSCLIPFPKAI